VGTPFLQDGLPVCYRFEAPRRYDRLFTGVTVPRPAWIANNAESTMSGWDYAAMFVVWYLLAPRVAIGNDSNLNFTTRATWPAFFLHSRRFPRLLALVVAYGLMTMAAYVLVSYVVESTLKRFLLTFPLSDVLLLLLILGGGLIYGLFDPSPLAIHARTEPARAPSRFEEDDDSFD
jgi:hypothetical protein